MAREASGRLEISFKGEERQTALGVGSDTSRLPHHHSIVAEFANGTANGQVDRVWSTSTGTVTAGAPVTVDLIGSLTSKLDSALTVSFVDLELLIIENTAAAGNLLVGGATNAVGITAAANDIIVIPPGGALCWYGGTAGISPGAGATDELKIDASAGTVTYKATAVGRSA